MGSTIECKTHIDAPKREPWFIRSGYIVLLICEITPIVTLVYSYQYY